MVSCHVTRTPPPDCLTPSVRREPLWSHFSRCRPPLGVSSPDRWQLEPLPPPPDVGVSRGRRSCETSPESLTRQARDLSPRALQRRAVDLASQNTRLRGSRASSQAGRERRRQSDRPASGAAAGPVGEAWDRFRDEQEGWAPSCGVLSDPKTGTINSDGRVESTLVYCDEQTNKL